MLYSAEHVIASAYNLCYLDYREYTDETGNHKLLSFNAAGDAPELVNAYMLLHKNYTDLEVGIAVETYRPLVGHQPDTERCLQRTSEYLRHLVQSCYGNVAMRGLTEPEKQQLQKFKDDSKGKLVLSTPRPLPRFVRARLRTQLF